jgi:hypothetical protein
MFTRTDGVSLLYKGLTHSFHGESESCKSMVAHAEAVQVLMAGGTVLYVDFESDGATVVDRLLTLGASPDAIRGRFSYRKPETKPTTTVLQLAEWVQLLHHSFDLAVIDGVTDALGVYGYSTVDNDDLTRWAIELPGR